MATVHKKQDDGSIISFKAHKPTDVSEVPEEIEGMRVEGVELPQVVVKRFTESQIEEIERRGLHDEFKADMELARKYNLVIEDRPREMAIIEAQKLAGQQMALERNVASLQRQNDDEFRQHKAAKADLDQAQKGGNPAEIAVAEQKFHDVTTKWQETNAAQKEAAMELEKFNVVQNAAGAKVREGEAPKFTRSEIADPNFYRLHQEEILEASRLGNITDDLSAAVPTAAAQQG